MTTERSLYLYTELVKSARTVEHAERHWKITFDNFYRKSEAHDLIKWMQNKDNCRLISDVTGPFYLPIGVQEYSQLKQHYQNAFIFFFGTKKIITYYE